MATLKSNKIAELRHRENLTQKELAKKIGISASAIAMYEIGARTPALKTAKKLADYFGVQIEDIFFSNVTHELNVNMDKKEVG